MNQEQNNFNQNSFNMQGNNGIPNNQPLNNFNPSSNTNQNQSLVDNQGLQNNQNINNAFNQGVQQGTNINQPIFNPQHQPTPNYQEPINQMNMQETVQQPINNTFESGNGNNQSFNSKPQKKIKLGLIIGIVIAVIVIALVVFIFTNNTKPNSGDINDEIINCQFDGELVQGVEYVNGQYTYRYMLDLDGWSVELTDKESTEPVTTKLCAYINEKPIVSMKSMFSYSAATKIDFSSFDTSNVTDMSYMFAFSAVTNFDLSSFNTSKVWSMIDMFAGIKTKTLDLSNFDTRNVGEFLSMFSGSKIEFLDLSSFDLNSAILIGGMFADSEIDTLDLSSFDMTNIPLEQMEGMFRNCKTTKGYAKNQNNADKLNNTSEKPEGLIFIVK